LYEIARLSWQLRWLALRATTHVLASGGVVAARAGVADDEWDAALQAIDGHFLQSTAWQRVQRALGYPVLTERGDGWMWAASVRTGVFPRYMYTPYGPAATEHLDDALRSAAAAGRTHRVDFVRVEPASARARFALDHMHARPTDDIQPRWTWLLDLDVAEGQLRAGLSAGHRGSINAAPRKGIEIRVTRQPGDMDVFIALQRRAASQGAFSGRPAEYHRTAARVLMPTGAACLYVAEVNGRPIAAAVAFDFGRTRYYAHAVSDREGRRLSAAAPLVWSMIVDARSAGKQSFDFWGVRPDAPPGHPWSGFTQFKMAFGGRLAERGGTWDVPLRALRYSLYARLRRIRR
jgi:lipid II:glycine glycyltransferase (peptidoglycan interpeptide bridge formation enzyme)